MTAHQRRLFLSAEVNTRGEIVGWKKIGQIQDNWEQPWLIFSTENICSKFLHKGFVEINLDLS